jgi:3-hydroxyisobutyrate dehydrogenase-like beta-hydroxyacid dehydrogenase
MNTLKIGWIGLGNMGNPMVQNLLKAGYSVTVFNRSKDKEVPLIALELPQPQVRRINRDMRSSYYHVIK